MTGTIATWLRGRSASKGGERRLVDAPPVAPALHPDVERFERRDLDGAPAVGLLKPHGLDRVGVDRDRDAVLMLVPGSSKARRSSCNLSRNGTNVRTTPTSAGSGLV